MKITPDKQLDSSCQYINTAAQIPNDLK